jgi:hypothetical protein
MNIFPPSLIYDLLSVQNAHLMILNKRSPISQKGSPKQFPIIQGHFSMLRLGLSYLYKPFAMLQVCRAWNPVDSGLLV